MAQTTFIPHRRLPLAFRLSFILILAAVLPLLITVGISEYNARPVLIDQANKAMATDAHTRIQLINAYLTERTLDAQTLSQVPTVQSFLPIPPTNPPTAAFLEAAPYATYALAAGEYRDKHYIAWWLFYPNGTPGLSYPQHIQPHHYGQYIVPPEMLQAVQADKNGQAILSPVYYDPSIQKAFIDIYSPIFANGQPGQKFLGFMRASLNLDTIWDTVKSDQGFNHSGSALLLDANGVRIADANPQSPNLFTAVTTLPAQIQQQITSENWYGQNGTVKIQPDSSLASAAQRSSSRSTFTFTPGGQSDTYQAASEKTTVIPSPWTYVVISPSSSVTQIADDQLRYTIIVAIVVAALAALIGFWVSSRISRPIRRSVDQLRENSEALNGLAKKQQSASSEQLWVVDSIQVGLQSVQYYTDATRIAAHKLGEVGTELDQNWRRQNIETIKQGLQQVISAANYIEKATHYQSDSGQKLSTAIKVTTQVNEQLADGAISATEAASQLEQVVNDLRSVIGQ